MSCDYWCLLHPQGHSAKRRIVKFLLLRMNGGVSFTCRCGAVCGAASLVSSRPRPRRFWMWRHLWSLSGDFPLGSKSPPLTRKARTGLRRRLWCLLWESETQLKTCFFFFVLSTESRKSSYDLNDLTADVSSGSCSSGGIRSRENLFTMLLINLNNSVN